MELGWERFDVEERDGVKRRICSRLKHVDKVKYFHNSPTTSPPENSSKKNKKEINMFDDVDHQEECAAAVVARTADAVPRVVRSAVDPGS